MAIETSGNFTYDINKHRYILTQDGVINLRGINVLVDGNFETSTEADFFLEKVSRDVYNYMYNQKTGLISGSKYTIRKNVIEYFIFRNATDEVDFLINAMLDQVEYSIQSAGDLMTNEFQFNQTLLSEDDKMNAWISPVAKNTLKQSVIGFPGTISFTIPTDEFRIGY